MDRFLSYYLERSDRILEGGSLPIRMLTNFSMEELPGKFMQIRHLSRAAILEIEFVWIILGLVEQRYAFHNNCIQLHVTIYIYIYCIIHKSPDFSG